MGRRIQHRMFLRASRALSGCLARRPLGVLLRAGVCQDVHQEEGTRKGGKRRQIGTQERGSRHKKEEVAGLVIGKVQNLWALRKLRKSECFEDVGIQCEFSSPEEVIAPARGRLASRGARGPWNSRERGNSGSKTNSRSAQGLLGILWDGLERAP